MPYFTADILCEGFLVIPTTTRETATARSSTRAEPYTQFPLQSVFSTSSSIFPPFFFLLKKAPEEKIPKLPSFAPIDFYLFLTQSGTTKPAV